MREGEKKNGEENNIYTNELQFVYEHDYLTGLENRTTVFKNITEIIKESSTDTVFAFVRFDIDRFRMYNTVMGEAEGDKLICYVAELLKQAVEGIESCAYGRLMADIFCLCLPYNEKKLNQIINYIVDNLVNYKKDYLIEPSFGIYILDDKAINVESMLTKATLAVEKCKNKYKTFIGIYDKSMDEKDEEEQAIINEMQAALDENQFEVYLQPKYNIRTEKPCGAEALCRWVHPKKGMIMPGVFIPIFEKNGFIVELDHYMWESTCKLLHKWKEEDTYVYPISVNISRISLYDSNIVQILKDLIKKYDIEPELMNLEVTESAYMSSPELMKNILNKLKEAGFVIMMDDFGSGYSSLNALKKINVDILKIDMQCLPTAKHDVRSEKILASIISMSNRLNLVTIVEGVENEGQKNFLKSVGCNYVQGFYYAKPMKVSDYESLIKNTAPKLIEPVKIEPEEESFDIWSSDFENNLLLKGISLPFAICEIIGENYEIVRKNDAYIDEFEGEEQVKKETVTEYRINQFWELCQKAILTRKYAEQDIKLIFENDKIKWYRVRVQYIKTTQFSEVVCIVLTDITPEKTYLTEVEKFWQRIGNTQIQKTKILVVDDSDVSRDIISLSFKSEYEVIEAEDGEQGLKLLNKYKDSIELIFLDLMMPNMKGEEFLEYKNKMEDVSSIPVIIISSEDNSDTQINMLKSGVNDYIIKPFVPEVLKRRVKNVLEYNTRFRTLVSEYKDAQETSSLSKTQKKDNRPDVFVISQVMEYIRFLQKSFDVVRLVNPKETSIVTINDDDEFVEEKYSCFKAWSKDVRCANCSSVCAEYQGCAKTKYEFIENDIFYVVSRPIQIVKKDDTIFNGVLEIVSHVSDHLLMRQVNGKTMRELIEETQSKIYRDELTRCYNRRYLREMLFLHHGQNVLATSVGMIMVDIDKFKGINDNYGHLFGDKVLVDIAKYLCSQTRPTDSVIRYGGDEFLIALTDCTEEQVLETKKRLKKHITKQKIAGIHISVSCGDIFIDHFDRNQELLSKMVEEVDAEMYKDKKR